MADAVDEQQQSSFACPHCGRRYRWRRELAGKQARCSCGKTITTPLSVTAPADVVERIVREQQYDLVTDDDLDRTCRHPDVATASAAAAKARRILQTSADPAAVAAALPDAVVPVYSRPPLRDAEADAEANKAAIYKLVIPLILIILLAIGIAITRRTKQITAPVPLGQDAMIEQLIKDHDGTEANSWLRNLPTRMVMGMSRNQAEDRIREMYDLGAQRVLAFDPVITKQLVIVLPPNALPADKAARARLFNYVSKWDLEMQRTPATDMGQKYLLVRLP